MEGRSGYWWLKDKPTMQNILVDKFCMGSPKILIFGESGADPSTYYLNGV